MNRILERTASDVYIVCDVAFCNSYSSMSSYDRLPCRASSDGRTATGRLLRSRRARCCDRLSWSVVGWRANGHNWLLFIIVVVIKQACQQLVHGVTRLAAATLAESDLSGVCRALAELAVSRLGLASQNAHQDIDELLLCHRATVQPLAHAEH